MSGRVDETRGAVAALAEAARAFETATENYARHFSGGGKFGYVTDNERTVFLSVRRSLANIRGVDISGVCLSIRPVGGIGSGARPACPARCAEYRQPDLLEIIREESETRNGTPAPSGG